MSIVSTHFSQMRPLEEILDGIREELKTLSIEELYQEGDNCDELRYLIDREIDRREIGKRTKRAIMEEEK